VPIPSTLVDRLYGRSNAQRWHVSNDRFAEALETSAERAFAGRDWMARDLERYLNGLHLEDLALACACAAGDEGAWDHFVLEQRPHLYRAADALDASGGARDLADSLYAELFGLKERGGERQSLFRYFHGRSSLTTWLRTILSQRYIDRWRETRRVEALPDEGSSQPLVAASESHDLDRGRQLTLVLEALKHAIANLVPRDRLRLACYYAQQMTLAETARLLGEHEATASRHLARVRRLIRRDIERQLRVDQRLTEAEIAQCFASAMQDPGPMDLREMLEPAEVRKESTVDRSI
jgi:RNA polymerase sigma-70 factor (ECF subfamily)